MFNQEWLYFDFLEYGYNKGINVKYVQNQYNSLDVENDEVLVKDNQKMPMRQW